MTKLECSELYMHTKRNVVTFQTNEEEDKMYKQGSDPQDKARLSRVEDAVEGSDQHQEGVGGKRASSMGIDWAALFSGTRRHERPMMGELLRSGDSAPRDFETG